MADFAVQTQQQSRTVIASSDLLAGTGQNYFAWGLTTASATWPTANRAMFIPFLIHDPYLVHSLFAFNGNTVSGNIDVGIYTDGGVLLVSAGSTAQAGTNVVQNFNVTDTLLLPGVYYMACVKNDTAGTLFTISAGGSALARSSGMLSQSTAFPLPNPATFTNAQDSYQPLIGVVGKSV